MLKVIVVDDQTEILEQVAMGIEAYVKFEKLDVNLTLATGDPQAVLAYVRENPNDKYLFFLDIDLATESYTGIDLASELRKLLPYEAIVFLTSHEELSLIVLEHRVLPLDYIIKQSDFTEIMKAVKIDLRRTLELIGQESKVNKSYFTYVKRGRHYRIATTDIYYFEAMPGSPHLISLYANNKRLNIRRSLSQIEERLDADFYRCHRGYLINLARVVALDPVEKMVYFDEEQTIACPVATRRLRDLKRKLTWQKLKMMLCLGFYYTVQKEARTKNPGLFYLRLRFLKRLWRSSKIRRATKTMATM